MSPFHKFIFKLSAAVLVATFVCSAAFVPQSAYAFAGGNGSPGNPYRIANCTHLREMWDEDNYDALHDKHYILTANIDCSSVNDFTPLYNGNYVFSGTLDGKGHTISNITITSANNLTVALFGVAVDATFKKFKLDHITINHSGTFYTGALIGATTNTIIEDVHATNVSITSQASFVGGLVGSFDAYEGEGVITRSSVSGTLTATGNNAVVIGGLVGAAEAAPDSSVTLSQVFADVDLIVTQGHTVGGLAGQLAASGGQLELQNAYAWTAITNPNGERIGGLVGQLSGSGITLERSYAWGDVEAGDYLGGLIGSVSDPSDNDSYTIRHTFALTTASTTSSNKGGLIGSNEASIFQLIAANNFFDQTVFGASNCGSGTPFFGCQAVNTDGSQPNYFINTNSVEPMSSWDFTPNGVWIAQASTPPVFRGLDFGPESTYILSFNTQGGSSESPITDLFAGLDVTLPAAPTRTGYTFQNWNTQANGGGASYDPGDPFIMPGANTTLYAIWQQDGNSNGGDEEGSSSSSRRSGSSVQTRVANLAAQGNVADANALRAEYPWLFLDGIAAPVPSGFCPRYTFTRTLQFGSQGEDVRALQRFLNCAGFRLAESGPGSPGQETTYFLERTRISLIAFQERYSSEILAPIGAQSGTGIFAGYSRAKAHSLMAP